MIKLSRPNCPNPAPLENKKTYKDPANKDALRISNNSKCMYCESIIGHTHFGDVEHIIPKSLFPDLEFSWENLGYVCAICNNKKSDYYDVDTPLIDPYSEDPSKLVIAIGGYIFSRAGSIRGQATVEVIDLNRPQLVERRSARVSEIHKFVDRIALQQNQLLREKAVAALLADVGTESEYSLVSRTAATAFLSDL